MNLALLIFAWIAPPVCATIPFLRRGDRGGLGFLMVVGTAFQFLLALPTGIAQALGVIGGIGGNPLGVRLLVPLAGAPFNMGGWTVRAAFEALVGPLEFLVGDRTATVLSNAGFYVCLLAIQVALLAFLFAQVWRGEGPRRRLVVALLAAGFLVNSWVNVTWPWWGS